MNASGTASFYDELAPSYHLLYGDWEASVKRQGAALAELLRADGVAPGEPVHDAACGIGTQTLGLLQHDYRVSASDLSPGAVERLNAELARGNLPAEARVDDLRTLEHVPSGSLAAVIACDNSIPHLLTDEEILRAFKCCHRCLRRGGVAVFSVRDYAVIERRNPDVRPYGMRVEGGCRFLAVQVWEWDGDCYDLRMIGRKRVMQAWKIASSGGFDSLRCAAIAKSIIMAVAAGDITRADADGFVAALEERARAGAFFANAFGYNVAGTKM